MNHDYISRQLSILRFLSNSEFRHIRFLFAVQTCSCLTTLPSLRYCFLSKRLRYSREIPYPVIDLVGLQTRCTAYRATRNEEQLQQLTCSVLVDGGYFVAATALLSCSACLPPRDIIRRRSTVRDLPLGPSDHALTQDTVVDVLVFLALSTRSLSSRTHH